MKCLRKTVLFMTGFCVYITIEVCFRGYSYPIMGLCGGLILIMVDLINEKISWDMDILLQGIIGAAVATLIEFIIGMICIRCGFALMWNYSDMPLNYKGIICLPYSIVWIFVSIAGVFLADAINYYVFGRLPEPYYKLFGRTIIKYPKRK